MHKDIEGRLIPYVHEWYSEIAGPNPPLVQITTFVAAAVAAATTTPVSVCLCCHPFFCFAVTSSPSQSSVHDDELK